MTRTTTKTAPSFFQSYAPYFPMIRNFALALCLGAVHLFYFLPSAATTWPLLLSGVAHYAMGYLLIILALSKIPSFRSFRKTFEQYDWMAARFPRWYPAVFLGLELLLGLLYLLGMAPLLTHLMLTCIMSLGTLGVLEALLKQESARQKGENMPCFTCACAGGNNGVPLSKLTLFENLMMISMGAYTLLQQACSSLLVACSPPLISLGALIYAYQKPEQSLGALERVRSGLFLRPPVALSPKPLSAPARPSSSCCS